MSEHLVELFKDAVVGGPIVYNNTLYTIDLMYDGLTAESAFSNPEQDELTYTYTPNMFHPLQNLKRYSFREVLNDKTGVLVLSQEIQTISPIWSWILLLPLLIDEM